MPMEVLEALSEPDIDEKIIIKKPPYQIYEEGEESILIDNPMIYVLNINKQYFVTWHKRCLEKDVKYPLAGDRSVRSTKINMVFEKVKEKIGYKINSCDFKTDIDFSFLDERLEKHRIK